MVVLRCPYCGEEVKQGMNFCSNCGKEIDKPLIDEYATYHNEFGGFIVKSVGLFFLVIIIFSMMATWFRQLGLWFCVCMTFVIVILVVMVLKKIF